MENVDASLEYFSYSMLWRAFKPLWTIFLWDVMPWKKLSACCWGMMISSSCSCV